MQKLSTKKILEQNLDRSVPAQLADLKILLHNVRSMHNVGAAFRSADAFGIGEILISGYTPTPPGLKLPKQQLVPKSMWIGGMSKAISWIRQ